MDAIKPKLKKKTCYNKKVPLGVTIMNSIRKTILILVLLIPFTIYATSEMTASEGEKVGVIQTTNKDIVSEELKGEVYKLQKNPVRQEIQRVFGSNWRLAYAIMMSESSGRVEVTNTNTRNCGRTGELSIDRGLFQINDCWHPDVSIDCAFDMKCNIKEAYRISNGGTNWQPWFGYTNGHYRKFL